MRLFVACDLPEEIREKLAKVQEFLKSEDDKIKWVEKENLHLTLKFIGEVEEEKAEKIKAALSSVKFRPFLTSVAEFGIFPPRGKIRVVWMGLLPQDKIIDLHEMIDAALEKIGIEKDARFQAHITLGRVKYIEDKEGFSRKVSKIKERFESEPFKIDRFYLKKSTLTPKGPIYEDLKEFAAAFQ